MKNTQKTILLFVLFMISFFLDIPLSNFAKQLQNPYLTQIMLFVSNDLTMIFITIFVIIFFLIKKRKDLVFYSVAGILTSLAIVFIIKSLYFRPRPFQDLGVLSIDGSKNSSFPSGHVTRISAFVPFAWIYKKSRFFILAIVILVAFSRIYLQAHYLSDIIFGFILGYYTSLFFLYFSKKRNKLNSILTRI